MPDATNHVAAGISLLKINLVTADIRPLQPNFFQLNIQITAETQRPPACLNCSLEPAARFAALNRNKLDFLCASAPLRLNSIPLANVKNPNNRRDTETASLD
jgi:hypothetical protein